MDFIKTNLLAKITKEGKKNSSIGFSSIKIISIGLDKKGNIDALICISNRATLDSYTGEDLIDIFENYNFTESTY